MTCNSKFNLYRSISTKQIISSNFKQLNKKKSGLMVLVIQVLARNRQKCDGVKPAKEIPKPL